MSTLQQDLRYALRGAIRNPLFTAIITGAIAIAANTALALRAE